MTFTIDGTDIYDYLASIDNDGINFTYQDVDGPNAGRDLDDGTLTRDRIAEKRRIDLVSLPLLLADASILLSLLQSEWVFVTYTDPEAGGDITKTMYCGDRKVSGVIVEGEENWIGAFALIEQ